MACRPGALAAVGFVAYERLIGAPPTVETAAVSAAFPSQAVTLLNATGYVVAQRKAAVASKATGRLEWLGVMEGSRVKRDAVIARIESRDVAASRDQAKANVGVAAANLEQVRAEAREAQVNLARSRDLAEKKYISGSTLDSAVARDDKARAGGALGRGGARRGAGEPQGRRGGARPDADPRAVRRRGAHQERQRRRQHHAVLQPPPTPRARW